MAQENAFGMVMAVLLGLLIFFVLLIAPTRVNADRGKTIYAFDLTTCPQTENTEYYYKGHIINCDSETFNDCNGNFDELINRKMQPICIDDPMLNVKN